MYKPPANRIMWPEMTIYIASRVIFLASIAVLIAWFVS